MRLAAIQFRPTKGDWDGSARRLLRLVTDAAQDGADLIVCPEMALTGYLFADADAAASVAEAPRGRTLERFAPVCAAHGCHLVLGYPERDPDTGRLYNAALVIGPHGELRCNYRKRLLYIADTTWADPGDSDYGYPPLPYPLLSVRCRSGEQVMVSVGVCMDLNDDRFTSFLRQRRPDVVAFCTNWVHQGFDIRPYWRQRLRMTGCHLVAADTYGVEALDDADEPETRFLGRSAILDPYGQTLALAPEEGDAVLGVDVLIQIV